MSDVRANLHDLPLVPASDVKKRGWRGLMRALGSAGALVITNHSGPEAVILSVQEFERLVALAGNTESKIPISLEVLRHRFDERLAVLAQSDAADRLRAISERSATLKGKVKAGTGLR